MFYVLFVQSAAFRLEDPCFYPDAFLLHLLDAVAADALIRVKHADDHPPDFVFNHGIHARRRLAVMAAGFQRDVQRGPAHIFFSVLESVHFRVVAAEVVMVSVCDDAAFFNDYRADHRIRADFTQPAARQLQRQPHEFFIGS